MADGITLKRTVEARDGRQLNQFELTIDASLAPSQSSERKFSVLHQPAPVTGKPRAPAVQLKGVRAIGMSAAAVSTIGKAPPPLDDDPLLSRWLITAPADVMTGELIFRGEWLTRSTGATTRFEERIPAGTDLNKDELTILLDTSVPQVASRINEVTPQVLSASATDEPGKAIEILKHVQKLLDDGLAPVWASIEGLPTKSGTPLMAADPESLDPEELEESWAQMLSEFLVGTPYAGPGVNTFGDATKGDALLFGKILDEADPAFPIIYACQHLCTAAGASRGISEAPTKPVDARSAAGMDAWGEGAGRLVRTALAANAVATDALANDVLKPGTSYVASDVAHVAFVLRAFKAGRLQLIDTGGMRTSPGVVTPFGAAGAVDESSSLTLGGLNFDTQLVTKVARPLRHIGVPPPSDLAGAIGRMKRARPLGVARCMLLDRLPDAKAKGVSLQDRLRFASPLVPMWFRDQNYSILRMLWSMRSHPHADLFEVRWWIAFPQHEVATAMLESRAFSWKKIEDAAKVRKVTPRLLLHPAVYLGSLPNGQVRFVGRFSTKINDKGKTDSTWFDSVENKTFQPPDSNAVLPTITERGLPLEAPVGVAGGERPKGFDRLLSIDKAQIPEYLSSVIGG